MTFLPIIPTTSLAGWNFLNRTLETQLDVHANTSEISRDTEYFQENIGSINTAEELVSDRRLLRVALGAFGLSDDIDNRYLIQKVLEGDTSDSSSLANKLTDSRYAAFSESFGFGDLDIPNTKISDFSNGIIEKYQNQTFEIAVGDQDEDMRLALNFARSMPEIGSSTTDNDTKWFLIMGSSSLRTVFETALGLPSDFGSLDIDKQLEIFQDKSQRSFGTSDISDLADPEVMDKIVETYLLRSQINELQTNQAGSIALTLLQSSSLFS